MWYPWLLWGADHLWFVGVSLSQRMNLCLINMHINVYMRFKKLFPYVGCMGNHQRSSLEMQNSGTASNRTEPRHGWEETEMGNKNNVTAAWWCGRDRKSQERRTGNGGRCIKPWACEVEASGCARKASETHEALTMCQALGWALRVLFSPYEMWPLFIL